MSNDKWVSEAHEYAIVTVGELVEYLNSGPIKATTRLFLMRVRDDGDLETGHRDYETVVQLVVDHAGDLLLVTRGELKDDWS